MRYTARPKNLILSRTPSKLKNDEKIHRIVTNRYLTKELKRMTVLGSKGFSTFIYVYDNGRSERHG